MSLGSKRSPSPLPPHFDTIRKTRVIAKEQDSKTSTTDSDIAHKASGSDGTTATPQRGQELLPLSPFLSQGSTHENINDFILETTTKLAREGKRLTRAPQLFWRPHGVAFNWVTDPTARNESLRALLSVDIYRSVKVSGKQILTEFSLVLLLGSLARRRVNRRAKAYRVVNKPMRIIEDDDDLTEATSGAHISNHVTPSLVRTAAGQTLLSHELAVGPVPAETESSQSNVHQTSHERNAEGSSRLSAHSRSTSPKLRITEAQGAMTREVRLPFTSADNRASVLPYTSSRVDDAESIHRNDTDEVVGASRAGNLPDVDDVLHKKRRADYGNWQSLAIESSDAEMDDARPSSRDSSPERAFPPQVTDSVPGLNFLPQTYDASGLVLPKGSSSGAHYDMNSDVELSFDEEDPPSPRGSQHKSSRALSRRTRQRVGGEHGSPAKPSVQRYRQRRAMQPIASRLNDRANTMDEDDSDGDIVSKTVKGISSPKMVIASQQRRQDPALHGSRSTSSRSSSLSQSGRAARSRTSDSSAHVEFGSDEGEHELGVQKGPAGQTVVIPKSEFARGRRLLASRDQVIPLATILMRGDAHFVDQRRKTRITRWSLPVEDDARHVEDACLIGESTIVVGYNKGPCQVSLIPVRENQRPYRIDLTHRGHSTVVENRTAGTSYPNPGIACLAPVGSDSFLSGGHDKTVRHWKVTPNGGQREERAAFSASSVRVPIEHMQSVQALAYSSWNNAIYAAAGDRIATARLDSRAPSEPARVSGRVTQVHVHPQDPRLIALEIDHMDHQVQLYDTREGGFGGKPWLEFGYRAAPPKPRSASRPVSSTFVPKLGSRYIRGSTMNSLFARGYGDGVVLVWDYRNGGQKVRIDMVTHLPFRSLISYSALVPASAGGPAEGA
ncbi:hypothetical protein ONZ51_g606 [Trametes cubensis]|uniref:Uncharacterized protein n=1 Tax=Trametes cubensis TaxID=1111947 RepID=A0AAD7U549_9APHY|nr:hypothetical protein ONZ51_g606 [Trametes cubensis]